MTLEPEEKRIIEVSLKDIDGEILDPMISDRGFTVNNSHLAFAKLFAGHLEEAVREKFGATGTSLKDHLLSLVTRFSATNGISPFSNRDGESKALFEVLLEAKMTSKVTEKLSLCVNLGDYSLFSNSFLAKDHGSKECRAIGREAYDIAFQLSEENSAVNIYSLLSRGFLEFEDCLRTAKKTFAQAA